MTLYHWRGWLASAFGAGLFASSLTGTYAWSNGLWGLFAGAFLLALWMLVLAWWNAAQPPWPAPQGKDRGIDEETAVHRLLLDAAPTPLLAIEPDVVRVLNRSARRIFGADDRILPVPAALLDPSAETLRHEGRLWRIDRVEASAQLAVAALIDVEHEELAAEARASADLIEILGHELLNGLSPIVSLAESAQFAVEQEPVDASLLKEILGPLARRADGLERFATNYRALARLPEPRLASVPLAEFVEDIARLYAERWSASLTVAYDAAARWTMDRDQMHQAVWALLNNAAESADVHGSAQVGLKASVSKDRLSITVSDNGPGIRPENTVLIFRPFHTTKPDGSGIGLSLARQIARAHGGSLELVGAHPTAFRIEIR
tara:strand:- start:220 stop:1350 length:1131 start_codon:yes stop_codon:yes gene_type:complete